MRSGRSSPAPESPQSLRFAGSLHPVWLGVAALPCWGWLCEPGTNVLHLLPQLRDHRHLAKQLRDLRISLREQLPQPRISATQPRSIITRTGRFGRRRHFITAGHR